MNNQTETRKKINQRSVHPREALHDPDDDQEAASLLRLAGRDPSVYTSRRSRPGARSTYTVTQGVDLKEGDEFVFGRLRRRDQPDLRRTRKAQADRCLPEQAAIAKGVPIQMDFVLSEVFEDGHEQVIADDDEITVQYHDDFWAVPGDDTPRPRSRTASGRPAKVCVSPIPNSTWPLPRRAGRTVGRVRQHPARSGLRPDTTFLVFCLHFEPARWRHLPLFVRPDLSRSDGAPLGDGFAGTS